LPSVMPAKKIIKIFQKSIDEYSLMCYNNGNQRVLWLYFLNNI